MRKDIVIGFVLFISLLASIYPQTSLKASGFPPGMDDMFGGDKNTGKDGWQDVFNHTHNNQDWHSWMENWQDKYNQTSKGFKEKWKNVNHEFRKAAGKHAFIGSLSYENGYGVGSFIKFLFNDTEIVDYTVIRDENITVFNFVHIDGFHPINDPIVHGAVWRLDGDNASIEIHDNPVALFKIKTRFYSQRITFYLNDNIHVASSSSNSVHLNGLINGTIILAGRGDIEVSNTSIIVRVEGSKGCILFLAEPYINNSVCIHNYWKYEERIRNSIAKGKIFARILVDNSNSSDSMLFTNGSINCIASKNHIEVTVNSSGEGKIIVVDVSNRVLNLSSDDEIKIVVDGENISFEDYDDILNETGGIAKYTVINGSNGLIVIVYIPHFSVHTIDISKETASIAATPGFELFIVFFAIITVILVIQRKH